MLAMQYSFVLPADYDMGIIERRIRDKGPMLDGFPQLRFKAYLWAKKGEGGPENLYAPFYLWDQPDGLSNFLTGPGFATVTRDFGWPQVATWVVWHAELAKDLATARFASREIEPLASYSNLAAIRKSATDQAQALAGTDAIAHVTAFDPQTWRLLRLSLWRKLPQSLTEGAQIYNVGHVSEA
jgi:Domain of unknown function (DUF4865)